MCCKVFEFEEIDGSSIYINADEKCDPELALKLYINWYNKDFAPFEGLPSKNIDSIKFVRSFCPLDFYDESVKITRSN